MKAFFQKLYNRIKSPSGVSIGEMLAAVLIMLMASGIMVSVISLGARNFTKTMTRSESNVLYSTSMAAITNELEFASEVYYDGSGNVQKLIVNHDQDSYQYSILAPMDDYGQLSFNTVDGEETKSQELLSRSAYPNNLKVKVTKFTFQKKNGSQYFTVELSIKSNNDEIETESFDVLLANDHNIKSHEVDEDGNVKTASYLVRYVTVNDSGKEEEIGETKTLTGNVGDKTKAQPENIEGYSYNTISQQQILADGSTVVTIIYVKNVLQVIWKNYDGTILETDNSVPYGTTPTYNKESNPTRPESEGKKYTFTGWDPTPGPVKENTEYMAVFSEEATTADITFNAGGGHFADGTDSKVVTVKIGEMPSIDETPVKDRTAQYTYTFSGWTPEISKVTGAATYTANYKETLNKYTVSYSFSGDSETPEGVSAPESKEYAYGTSVSVETTGVIEGYTFSGWTTEDVTVSDGKFSMPSKNVTFTGKWTRKSYTVTTKYVDEANVSIKEATTQTLKYGEDYATSPADIAGYTLKTTPSNASGTNGTTDVTVTYVYAKNSYTVTTKFVDEDSNSIQDATTQTVKYGEGYTTSPATITGYTLKTTPSNASGTMGTKDVTVTYTYTKNKYKVSYSFSDDSETPEGVSAPESKEYAYGTSVGVETTGVIEGYTFSGWTTEDVTVSDGKFSMPSKNVTFTGKWTRKSYTVTTKYVDEANVSIKEATTQTLKYGEDYATSPADIAGYALKTTPSNASGTNGTKDVTVTYVYAKNSYTVTTKFVDEDSNSIQDATTQTVKYGEGYTTSPATITGYTLKTTPSNASGTMGTKDVTVTYIYTKNKYKVSYSFSDDSETPEGVSAPESKEYAYGISVSVETTVTIEGYTFSGWTTEDVTVSDGKFSMPSKDVTFTGKWTRKSYTVTTKYVDEANVSIKEATTQTLKYGEDYATSPADIAGYALKTTPSNASGTNGTKDVTVTYVYAKNSYTVTTKFVDEDSNSIQDATTQTVKYGEGYTTSPATITGYTLKTTPSNASGTMGTKDVMVTYIYTKNKYKVSYSFSDDSETPEGVSAPESKEYAYGISVSVETTVTIEGYTFSGWTTEDVTVSDGKFSMPSKDVAFTGEWTKNKCKVTFLANGGKFSDNTDQKILEVEYGSKISDWPTYPTKDNAQFLKWVWEETGAEFASDTKVFGDIRISASWVTMYKVTYYRYAAEDDTTCISESIAAGTQYSLKSGNDLGFSRDNYEFSHWSENLSGDNKHYIGETITVDKNYTFYAQWNNKKGVVNFESGNNKATGNTPSITAAIGSSVYLPECGYQLDGYMFTGWKNGNTIKQPGEQITLNAATTNYTAQWSKAVNLLLVSNTGVDPEEQVLVGPFVTGSSITIPTNTFTNGNMSFSEWNTKADGTGQSYAANSSIQNVQNDLTLYAIWIEPSHYLYYHANGGSAALPNEPIAAGGSVTLKDYPYGRSGDWTFSGWNTSESGNGTHYNVGETIENIHADIHLYAEWKKQYTVTFDSNGGTTGNITVKVDAGNSVGTNWPADPEKDNTVAFDGWYTADGVAFTKDTKVNSNITVTARWAETVSITYHMGYYQGLFTKYQVNTAFDQVVYVKKGSVATAIASPWGNTYTTWALGRTVTFQYWTTRTNGDGDHISVGGTIPSSLTQSNLDLYGWWKWK